MRTSRLHRLLALVAALSVAVAMPTVLCAETEPCPPTEPSACGMASCDMETVTGMSCCASEPFSAPTSGSGGLVVELAGLSAPASGLASSVVELPSHQHRARVLGPVSGDAPPVPIYTLLATLLI